MTNYELYTKILYTIKKCLIVADFNRITKKFILSLDSCQNPSDNELDTILYEHKKIYMSYCRLYDYVKSVYIEGKAYGYINDKFIDIIRDTIQYLSHYEIYKNDFVSPHLLPIFDNCLLFGSLDQGLENLEICWGLVYANN